MMSNKKRNRNYNNAECTAEGCKKRGEKRGMCHQHYMRWYKAQQPPCAADGCNMLSVARGLCDKHYTQWRRAQAHDEETASNEMHPAMREFLNRPPYNAKADGLESRRGVPLWIRRA